MTNEPVPNHLKRWWFCLGGTPGYLFVVQIITGILLAFYYQPAPATAYESVRYITEDATVGWYIRSMHKWAATFMIAAVILHQLRVYFTHAYRRPRELTWHCDETAARNTPQGKPVMLVEHYFSCPFCAATISVLVDASVEHQEYIEDCEVCCRPMSLEVVITDDEITRFDATVDE